MTDRTEWFSPDVDPAIGGVYERLYDEGEPAESVAFCKHLCGTWFAASLTVDGANESRVPSPLQNLKWRGLAKDPEQ